MSEPTTVSAEGVSLQVPDGWERVEAPGLAVGIAGPVGTATADGTQFRPSLTAIVVDAAPDADIRLLGTEAVAAARLVSPDVHVLAYDVWPLPDGTAGRRLEITLEQGGIPLCVRQWIALRDGRVITLTGTCDVAHLLAGGPIIERLATQALAAQETR